MTNLGDRDDPRAGVVPGEAMGQERSWKGGTQVLGRCWGEDAGWQQP